MDSGDTAWMITSSALVLMMTIPGLALFYGGMVRRKNVLATMAQSFGATCVITVLWMIIGYSIAFTPNPDASWNQFIGGFGYLFLKPMGLNAVSSLAPTIPESVYMFFQMTFAIITPALIAGALADRMKFSAFLWFMALWLLLVYCPIAHWVWGGGWLGSAGALDYAGGTVVHLNAGTAGLITCLVLGKRTGYGTENMAPHNLVLSIIGASLLWVGWFGFNAGSAVTANVNAGMAAAATQIATAAASLGWMVAEWIIAKKPSVLGMISGAVAGLVAITPASGFVDPTGALIIGVAAGVVCYISAVWMKRLFGYDDALDAWGVHGVGGALGALLTGAFASNAINSAAHGWLIDGNFGQMWIQLEDVGGTFIYCAVVTFIILKVIDMILGLRVSPEVEVEGLDINLHGETVHG
ncbi:MAG: ammonium transporter [Alphaproteobacteria bacterium]|nr:ammonium transporter [Alphaproteobacteria bacterium]MDE1986269.1 ammonium transporter [Alphaproteobacteria bacterium]MDE2162703.1 ammonium transporter [Alphaproteobacteria bacterium]MDE2266649.1 ammonium transporter [Alphaproteobacteria bacterium]MDE2499611.1 ammonium transporter [Alphaproteobacteria bacterium]